MKHSLFETPLSDEDIWRNNRAQIALRLNKLPHEIDQMPYVDYLEIMSVMGYNDEMARIMSHRRR